MKPQKSSASSHGCRRVVLLDDSSDAVSGLSWKLEEMGHIVHHLPIRSVPPSRVIRLKPDAVLRNIGRRPTDAYRFASELRKKLRLGRPPIIGLSLVEKEVHR